MKINLERKMLSGDLQLCANIADVMFCNCRQQNYSIDDSGNKTRVQSTQAFSAQQAWKPRFLIGCGNLCAVLIGQDNLSMKVLKSDWRIFKFKVVLQPCRKLSVT